MTSLLVRPSKTCLSDCQKSASVCVHLSKRVAVCLLNCTCIPTCPSPFVTFHLYNHAAFSSLHQSVWPFNTISPFSSIHPTPQSLNFPLPDTDDAFDPVLFTHLLFFLMPTASFPLTSDLMLSSDTGHSSQTLIWMMGGEVSNLKMSFHICVCVCAVFSLVFTWGKDMKKKTAKSSSKDKKKATKCYNAVLNKACLVNLQ